MSLENESITGLTPPGFDIKKYSKMKTTDVSLWQHNIYKRLISYISLQCHKNGQEEIFEMTRDEILESVSKGFEDIAFENSIDLDEEINGDFTSYLPPIVRARVKHIDLENIDEHDRNEEIDTLLATFSLRSPLSIAAINLQTPDHILFEHFKEWLKETRRKRGISEKKRLITDSIMRGWHQSRVLPYLDIMLWNRFMDQEFTDGDAARLIFPDDTTGSSLDVIRKTTKKHAKAIMGAEYTYSLQSQILKKRKENS